VDSPYNPNNVVWSVWVEQLLQAGVDFVCPNRTGTWPNTNAPSFAPMVAAVNNRGLTSQLKFALFDDNAASWTAQWNQANGRGYGYAQPFDLSDTNNWKFIYDYNYKLFYQTVPDTNRFKINGRPPIIIWSSAPLFITNAQGNLSRAMTYVRQCCQRDFGFDPFIIGDGAFHTHDTTCTAGIIDAEQRWFIAGPSGPSYTLTTFNGVKIGAACAEFQHPGQSGFLDPNHGQLFKTGLAGTVGAGALLTLCEGFTDCEEDAAMWRARNIDTSGNALYYTNTLYDYPNQRIGILRQYSRNPFPSTLLFEAEGCDYFGGANGGNGKVNFYRNGNIAIEPTGDTGGGYDVGWMQNGEWFEWENVPLNGTPLFILRVASPNSNCLAHFVIDGVTQPSQTLPNTGGWQTYTNVTFGPYGAYFNSYHTVRIVFDNGGVNFNWWETQATPPGAPSGLTATPANARVTLAWTASPGATGYNVQRSTVSGGSFSSIATLAGITYTDTGLTNGMTYYYVVSATNSLGQSGNSAQVDATPSSFIPGPVTQLIWSTQPGQASANQPFGQPPVLITADANGHPSTIGLAASVPITVSLVSQGPGGHLLGGPLNCDIGIGPGNSNGVCSFSGLGIDQIGSYTLQAVAGTGCSGVSAPTNGLPNCILWLDAADTTTFTIGSGGITTWADKSGAANNAVWSGGATPPTPGTEPLLSAYAGGQQQVVSFNGTNYYNISLTPLVGNPFTIIAMEIFGGGTNVSNVGTGGGILIGNDYNGTGTDRVLGFGYRNTNQFTIQLYADDINYTSSLGWLSNAAPRLWTGILNNTFRQYIYLNSGGPGSYVASRQGNSYLLGMAQAHVGAGGGGSVYRGEIAEMVVYNTNLTDVQRQSVESYLLNKWQGQFSYTAVSAPFQVYPANPSISIVTPTGAGTNGNTANSFTVNLSGVPGKTYRLLATTNLASTNWVSIATNTPATNGVAQFIDIGITNYPYRFYRAVSP
jgi:hypothetical protein